MKIVNFGAAEGVSGRQGVLKNLDRQKELAEEILAGRKSRQMFEELKELHCQFLNWLTVENLKG